MDERATRRRAAAAATAATAAAAVALLLLLLRLPFFSLLLSFLWLGRAGQRRRPILKRRERKGRHEGGEEGNSVSLSRE